MGANKPSPPLTLHHANRVQGMWPTIRFRRRRLALRWLRIVILLVDVRYGEGRPPLIIVTCVGLR